MSAVLHTVPTVDADASEIERMHLVFEKQRRAFAAHPFPAAELRVAKLRALIATLQRRKGDIAAAINADFGVRSPSESALADVMGPILEARHAVRHLRRWMKPRRRSTELLFLGNQAWVEAQPKGVVGIIGTWNFPFYLTLGPLVTALAAGNRAMIKTSEFVPRSGELLRELLGEIFDEDEVAVCSGAVRSAQAFNALPFDHIVFTGSPRVGSEVMRIAAANLTPVTLELGGKSPALVGPGADLADAALRITHGKVFNAGQVCVSPDYVLLPKGASAEFVAATRRAFTRMCPTVGGNPDYTSVVNDRQAQRHRQMLAQAQAGGAQLWPCGDFANGGAGRQIPLTLVTDPDLSSPLMTDEIFGPILPVVEYESFDDALDFVRQRPRPLALYGFGLNRAQERQVLEQTHAGGVSLNDWGWHVFQHDLPFGGIGNSGMGSYHGEEGFRELSHNKAVYKRRHWFPVQLFYPPYGNFIQRTAMRLYLGKHD